MSVSNFIVQKCQSFENGNKRRTAIIYALISQFFFITMYTCVGILRTSYSMYQVILGRCVIGYLITFSQCKSFDIKIFYSNKIVFRLLIISGILVAIKTVCLFLSYKYLNISDGFIISNTNPIWTTFLASYFLHEKITLRKLLSSFVSFLGIILVVRPSFLFEPTDIKSLNLPSNLERNQTLGCTLGLVGSVLISFITVIMRKLQDQYKCPSAAQLIYSFYATVIVAALCLVESPTQFVPSFDYFFYTLIISVCGYLAEFFFSRSFAFEEASIISPLQYTEIVLSFGIDVFVFNEKIFLSSILGSILVVVGSLATIFQ